MASNKEEERWQAKRSTMLERNKYMFNNSLMSDIKFAFPNTETTIPAHKYVLAISSPVFFAMFYGDLAETKDTVDITDCDPEIFLRFLRFLYCDEANFGDADCAIKVLYLADKYDVPSLAKESVKYLDGDMDPLSAIDIVTYARQFNDNSLERACWEVIDFNAEGIVADDSFLNIKHELLVSFLQRSSLRIEEATLFSAVDRWAAKRCEEAGMAVDGANKRHALGEDLLKKFRFLLMSPTEFSDVVLPKEILTKDEIIVQFKSFSKVDDRLKLVRPRQTNTKRPVFFCQTSDNYLSKNLQDLGDFKSQKLTFAASYQLVLCGLEFLFGRNDSRLRLRLSVSKTGEKIKELSATSRDYHSCSCSFPSSPRQGATNVFFNRPFPVSKETCYTIEVIEASSYCHKFSVSNRNSGFEQPASDYRSSGKTYGSITFRYCRGCHSHEISQNHPYQGGISALIFTTSPSLGSH